MALKEFTKEIFTRYGFTEDHILVYLTYLRVPRATSSEVFLSLNEAHEELTNDRVLEITKYLMEKGFLKKLEGIVDRYVPLEPYFELFTSESEILRNEIAKIKDKILTDQSNRFEKIETIQNKSIEKVENAIDAQIKDFFKDSDKKSKNKKERVDAATNRFNETSKVLEENLHGIIDKLNSDLKEISDTNVKGNETEINKTKDNLNNLIAELLGDFKQRVKDLEKDLKLNLDDHVERHKTVSNELKLKMEQILDKYMERMDKIILDLKARFSTLLREHSNHLKNTTETLQIEMKSSVENRHEVLTEQTNKFKTQTLKLIDNLLTSSNRFSDFAQEVANKGFFGPEKNQNIRQGSRKLRRIFYPFLNH